MKSHLPLLILLALLMTLISIVTLILLPRLVRDQITATDWRTARVISVAPLAHGAIVWLREDDAVYCVTDPALADQAAHFLQTGQPALIGYRTLHAAQADPLLTALTAYVRSQCLPPNGGASADDVITDLMATTAQDAAHANSRYTYKPEP